MVHVILPPSLDNNIPTNEGAWHSYRWGGGVVYADEFCVHFTEILLLHRIKTISD